VAAGNSHPNTKFSLVVKVSQKNFFMKKTSIITYQASNGESDINNLHLQRAFFPPFSPKKEKHKNYRLAQKSSNNKNNENCKEERQNAFLLFFFFGNIK
jgi:hypothetical protein